MIVRIKDDEGKVNDYELQKVLADNKIYKDFEDKVIRRFTQPATYMAHLYHSVGDVRWIQRLICELE